jgi:hypothetical protein
MNLGPTQVSALIGLGADAMDNMFDVTITPPVGLTTFQNLGAGRAGILNAADPGFENDLTIRSDGFEPPAFSAKTYKVGYKAVSIDRPSTKMEGEREFKITFRLDANYRAYRFLSAWKSLILQASSGYVTNALWGEGGDEAGLATPVGEINQVFGQVVVSAMARPIFQSNSMPFSAQGVSTGKFTEGSLSTSEASETIPSSLDLTTWQFKQVWLAKLDEPKFKTDGGDIIKVTATFKFGEFIDPIYNQYGG